MHVSKPDQTTLRIIAAAFPNYRGKSIQIEERDSIDVRSYWDGGSRSFYAFVRLADFARVSIPQQSAFDRPIPGADAAPIPPGFVCVEHVIFRGKDLGVRIYANGANLAALLPAQTDAPELTKAEKVVLECTCGLKSFARRENAERLGVDAGAWDAAKASLIARGLLGKNGAVTPEGRNLRDLLKLPSHYSESAWAKIA